MIKLKYLFLILMIVVGAIVADRFFSHAVYDEVGVAVVDYAKSDLEVLRRFGGVKNASIARMLKSEEAGKEYVEYSIYVSGEVSSGFAVVRVEGKLEDEPYFSVRSFYE